MKPKIKGQYRKLFTPEFHTAINGQSTRISMDQLTNNWTKYINGPLGYLYENKEDLRKKLKKGVKPKTAVVLDMSKAKSRGLAFSGETTSQKQDKAIKAFQAKAAKSTKRLKAKNEADKAKIKKAAKNEQDESFIKYKAEEEARYQKRKKAEEEKQKATKAASDKAYRERKKKEKATADKAAK